MPEPKLNGSADAKYLAKVENAIKILDQFSGTNLKAIDDAIREDLKAGK